MRLSADRVGGASDNFEKRRGYVFIFLFFSLLRLEENEGKELGSMHALRCAKHGIVAV